MAAVPVTIVAMIYPRDKSVKPYPATIAGYANITGLGVGGGPIEPPPDIQPEPPLTIWGPGDPRPGLPIAFPPGWIGGVPPELPEQPPAQVEPPHEGWNWSAAKSGWYFLYVPREGSAQPKR